jgi:hypothetical protein
MDSMSDERMPRRDWREAGRRIARAAAAGFLLACSVGLFYVGMLAWDAGRLGASEAGAGPKGLPIVGLAALTTLGATALIRSAFLPPNWPDEEQL